MQERNHSKELKALPEKRSMHIPTRVSIGFSSHFRFSIWLNLIKTWVCEYLCQSAALHISHVGVLCLLKVAWWPIVLVFGYCLPLGELRWQSAAVRTITLWKMEEDNLINTRKQNMCLHQLTDKISHFFYISLLGLLLGFRHSMVSYGRCLFLL